MQKTKPRHITTRLFKTNDKKEISKAARGKRNCMLRTKDENGNMFFFRNYTRKKTRGNFFKALKGKTVHLEFYVQQKISFKIKCKKDIFRYTKERIASRQSHIARWQENGTRWESVSTQRNEDHQKW